MIEKESNVMKKQHTPMASLQREVSWYSDEKPFMPEKDKNSSLKFGLIADERLYRGLEYEGDMHFLTEENWYYTIKYNRLDFILIESSLDTATGDWSMALTDPLFESTELYQLLQVAKEQNIPTIYWFTLDHEYHELFSPVAKYFDYVFCADPKETDKLKNMGIDAETLLPAVQPAIYNAITEYDGKQVERIPAVCDGLVDVLQTWNEKQELYKDLSEFGVKFFDSRNQIWQSKVNDLEIASENLLATISFESKLALFKKANLYIDFSNRTTTRTARVWEAMEAAACRLPVIIHGKVEEDILETFTRHETIDNFFLIELVRHQKDELYRERAAQKAWREVVGNHTFSNRIQNICKKIDKEHDWNEWPSATLVTPSYRADFFKRVKENFEKINYPNKEWVFVFNGPYNEYNRIKAEMLGVENAKTIYVPSELHAGASLNAGITHAISKYVYRMDDDDIYGENYLLDIQLYLRSSNIDVVGKIFKYFYMKDNHEETLFARDIKNFSFNRPTFLTAENLPDFALICGATQGLHHEFDNNNIYSMKNFAGVDSALLNYLKEIKKDIKILVLDDLNFVVERRNDKSHTWNVNMNQIMNQVSKNTYSLTEVLV